jgi:hypothetical protein
MSTSPAATAKTKAFAPHHPWDRNFFLLMVALAWLGIGMGFGQDIAAHIQKHQPAFAPIVHFHAAVFVLWLVLFTVQVLLIRARKLSVHQQLGWGLVGLAGLMVIVGPATALSVQHAAKGNPHADPGFLSVQFTDILAFAGLVTAAILRRKVPASHKRLMLLGTLYITDAGFARWFGGAIEQRLGDGYWATWVSLYVAPASLMLLVGIYDLATRRRLHPAYLAGVAWVFAVQMLALGLYVLTPGWPGCARRIIAAWPG